jgi:hypothetical protein
MEDSFCLESSMNGVLFSESSGLMAVSFAALEEDAFLEDLWLAIDGGTDFLTQLEAFLGFC